MKNKTITAIYCRTAQKCDMGIEVQESMLRQYANEHGYSNIAVYSDNGYSGLTLDRPAFAQLQSDIADGIIQTVLVKDMCRVSRNSIALPKWVTDYSSDAVEFICVIGGYRNKVSNSDCISLRKIAELWAAIPKHQKNVFAHSQG